MSEDLKAIGHRIAKFYNTGNPAIADEIYDPGYVNCPCQTLSQFNS